MDERRHGRTIPHRWVLVAMFVVYVITRYPDVGGRINQGDSAKFQFLARTLGIGHAPGNPLYLMASALWVRVPLPLSDATKITLLSSIFGIVAVALLAHAVGVLGLPPVVRRPFVLETRSFAALLLGFGSLFWTLSTEAEVYTLGGVFVAGVALGMARWSRTHDFRGLLLAVGCMVGGLANHLTIAALGPAVLLVLVREQKGREALRSVRLWAVGLGTLVLALASYGWIAWRVRQGPLPYSEFPHGPWSASTFFRFVTAQGVMDSTFVKTTYPSAMVERLPDLLAQMQKQWSWPLLLFLPLGALRLAQVKGLFAEFILWAVLGHFAIAFFFRIPDPEGLFVPVSILLAVPLALAPVDGGERVVVPVASERVAAAMLVIHGALAAAHVAVLRTTSFSAYVQMTPEGQVVLNLPILQDVVPDRAMVAVPCGHYGCVEVMSYYHFVDPALREKGVSFVRFSWSEWNGEKTPLPYVDPKRRDGRPLCVLLANDVARLRQLGLEPVEIPRAPVRVLGRRFASAPLHCLM